MVKRVFDLIFSSLLIILLSPLFLIISLMIVIDSKGGIVFRQKRVGKNNHDFDIYKFRTMHTGSDKKGLLTVGMKDERVTRTGYFLRKYKLDELPQLFNVLIGNMSFAGPRPEVRRYVEMYNSEQLHVLDVKPGITDYASIDFANENELLAKSANPEDTYTSIIMPAKLKLNLKYIREQSFLTDMKIIFRTIRKIFLE
ncbi:MAG TPA: sugar transferase [Bacteroidia bacterium]|nr:sugar transferase [Bacteroidia bacterium]